MGRSRQDGRAVAYPRNPASGKLGKTKAKFLLEMLKTADLGPYSRNTLYANVGPALAVMAFLYNLRYYNTTLWDFVSVFPYAALNPDPYRGMPMLRYVEEVLTTCGRVADALPGQASAAVWREMGEK